MQTDNSAFCVELIHCGNRNIANPDDILEKNVFFMPMGLFALAGVLRENHFAVEIIHMDIETPENIEEILNFNSLDAVGFDCHWLNQSLVVLNTAELIKKIKPHVFVFLGGFTASFFAEEILAEHPAVDAIICGDAEVPIVQLCRALSAAKQAFDKCSPGEPSLSLKDVANLAWRDSSGEVKFNGFSYVASGQDMAQLDFAAVDLLRNWQIYRDTSRFFSKYESINSAPQFLLSAGRGCVYGCSFCGGNHRAQWCMNHRKEQVARPIDSVITTIKKAQTFGFSLFFINFDFPGCDDYYVKLFNRIKEEGIKIRFAFGSWGLPSKVIIDAMSACFIEAAVEISPESGDEGLRKKNKDHRLFYTNEELETCLEYIEAKGNIKAQLFFGYFLPFETSETIYTTLEFLTRTLCKYHDFIELYYGNLSTDPASLLFFDPDKYDVDIEVRCFMDYLARLKEHYILKKGAAPDMTVFKPRSIGADERDRLTAKIRLFNDLLFCFPDSISFTIKKAGHERVLVDYLREVDIPIGLGSSAGCFSLPGIKSILVNICRENHLLDGEINRSIEREYQEAMLHATAKLRQFYSYKSEVDQADKVAANREENRDSSFWAKTQSEVEKSLSRDNKMEFDFE